MLCYVVSRTGGEGADLAKEVVLDRNSVVLAVGDVPFVAWGEGSIIVHSP